MRPGIFIREEPESKVIVADMNCLDNRFRQSRRVTLCPNLTALVFCGGPVWPASGLKPEANRVLVARANALAA